MFWLMQMNFRKKFVKVAYVKYLPFILVVFGNLWIWRMFSENLLIGISAILASWFLYRSIKEERLKKLLIVFLLVLLGFQINYTKVRPLTYLNKQEQIIQLRRLNEYPPVKFTLAGKTIWVPLAHWLEERPETLTLYRIQENLSGVLNPNLYFFANHPNERVGIDEHESFPYILLPFFVVGLFGLSFRKNLAALTVSLFAPIVTVGLVGSEFAIEPISLFPFISLCGALGIEYAGEKVGKLKSDSLRRVLIILFIGLYLLILLQTFLYDRY